MLSGHALGDEFRRLCFDQFPTGRAEAVGPGDLLREHIFRYAAAGRHGRPGVGNADTLRDLQIIGMGPCRTLCESCAPMFTGGAGLVVSHKL